LPEQEREPVMGANEYCLICKTIELDSLPASTEDITFYECRQCSRHYSKSAGRALSYRWLHPISLLLYGVIFEPRPQSAARHIAENFRNGKKEEDLKFIIQEVKMELEHPTRNVRDILSMNQSEKDLREFLQLTISYLASGNQGIT
jgi:hypothetical protein